MIHTENADYDTGLPEPARSEPPSPEDRLARSRAKLQAWYLATYGEQQPEAQHPHDAQGGEPGWFSVLSDALADVPAATIAARWLRRWWARHPWRTTVDLAVAVTREVATPIAKKHPAMLVGAAVIAGMLLHRAKPWRWISAGAIVSSLIPRIDVATILHWFTATVNDLVAQRQSPSPADAPSPAPAEPEAPATVDPYVERATPTVH